MYMRTSCMCMTTPTPRPRGTFFILLSCLPTRRCPSKAPGGYENPGSGPLGASGLLPEAGLPRGWLSAQAFRAGQFLRPARGPYGLTWSRAHPFGAQLGCVCPPWGAGGFARAPLGVQVKRGVIGHLALGPSSDGPDANPSVRVHFSGAHLCT